MAFQIKGYWLSGTGIKTDPHLKPQCHILLHKVKRKNLKLCEVGEATSVHGILNNQGNKWLLNNDTGQWL
jgi:hypothetical protein